MNRHNRWMIKSQLLKTKLGQFVTQLDKSALKQFEGVTSLDEIQTLYLCRKNIQCLPQLDQVPALRVLWLATNAITDVSRLCNETPQLQQLYLNSNQVRSLQGFGKAHFLKKLNLSYNLIADIPLNLSLPLGLKTLILSKNKINSIEMLSCVSLPSLEVLYLSGNELTSARALRKLCSPLMKCIYLDDNKIVQFWKYDQLHIQAGGSVFLVNFEQTLEQVSTTIQKIGQIRGPRARCKGYSISYR